MVVSILTMGSCSFDARSVRRDAAEATPPVTDSERAAADPESEGGRSARAPTSFESAGAPAAGGDGSGVGAHAAESPGAAGAPDTPPPADDEAAREAEARPSAEDVARDDVDPAPSSPDAAEASDTAPAAESELPELFAVQREVFVLEAPSRKAKRLGYLRAGARVRRSAESFPGEGCSGGFYRVAPEGFVCPDGAAALRAGSAVQELLANEPDRLAPLPFVYARVKGSRPPFYVKLPSASEQQAVEGAAARSRRGTPFDDLPSSAAPSWLAAGERTPTVFGYPRRDPGVVAGQALLDSSFALRAVFDHGGRRFGLVNDLTLVPLDRVERVAASAFHGLSLEGASLPVAFVMRRGASLYSARGRAGLAPVRLLGYREAVPVTGERVRFGGVEYLRTTDGSFLRNERLIEVAPLSELPRWAKAGRRWIHVSIGQQSLVAYEGERPVYVTLVSTGLDGLGDPLTTRSTVRGQFRVHTKHVTAPMSSDEAGDEYDLRDVPWVQYFSEGYALHAAYWHDAFGSPRSHGCVNLSPRDARFLFHWTDPAVPQGWHGAFSLREGTLIDITP